MKTDKFVEKRTGREVRYHKTCVFYDLDYVENVITPIITKTTCVLCEEKRTGIMIAIPFLTFMNEFEPMKIGAIEAVETLNNILNAEDERH